MEAVFIMSRVRKTKRCSQRWQSGLLHEWVVYGMKWVVSVCTLWVWLLTVGEKSSRRMKNSSRTLWRLYRVTATARPQCSHVFIDNNKSCVWTCHAFIITPIRKLSKHILKTFLATFRLSGKHISVFFFFFFDFVGLSHYTKKDNWSDFHDSTPSAKYCS